MGGEQGLLWASVGVLVCVDVDAVCVPETLSCCELGADAAGLRVCTVLSSL